MGSLRPIDRLFQWTVVLLGFFLGARPIGDNSMFVHIRTGIDIVDGKGIPRSDPYSFTAAGEPWVVQSWLPSTLYGLAREIGGDGLLILVQGLATAVLAYLVFRLARPAGTTLRVVGIALAALAVGAPYWSPRPLLFGLVCLGLTIVIVTERRAAWLLVPVAWVWVNSHGSFPLGAVWLGLVAIGSGADQRRFDTKELRYLGWFGGGLLLASVNPLGPRLLLFPLVLGGKADSFRAIAEWRSPDFQGGLGRISLVGLLLVLAVAARQRVPWRAILPLVGFTALGLFALRNLAPLTLVAVAAMAAAAWSEQPTETKEPWRRLDRIGVAVGLLALVGVAVNATSAPALDLEPYPVAVVAEGERSGVLARTRRVAAQDFVGCYLILRRGRGAQVFLDDRYDMYPSRVSLAYIDLLGGKPGSLELLDRYRIDTVLWQRKQPLVGLLTVAGWREVHGDETWATFVRPGTWSGAS